jgi:7-cyano-7-deazaguanine synthase in queuosine biosynthesis
MGMQANDANQSLEERRVRANKIFTAFTDAEKIFPVLNMSKREIYDMLPDTIRNKFWSCRHPVYKEKNITSCGKCDTCIKLQEQGIR